MSKATDVLRTASSNFWFSRGRQFAESADGDVRELCAMAFLAGAQWQFRESCKLSPHIARFIEMVTLLWGEDTYAALTTGLRHASSGNASAEGTASCESGDDNGGVPAMLDAV